MMNEYEIVANYMTGSVPVNLKSLCSELGIEYQEVALDDDISGEIERIDNDFFKINVNKKDHINRKRFTLAHEIAHYIYHRELIGEGLDDNKAYRSTDKGRYHNCKVKEHHEIQANSFAASLLMPKDAVIQHKNKSIHDLADLFQVSQAAMRVRLNVLGIPVKEF